MTDAASGAGTPARVYAAIDIGASGGRVMAGRVGVYHVGADRVELEPVHRFANGAREIDGHLRWDLDKTYLRTAAYIVAINRVATVTRMRGMYA